MKKRIYFHREKTRQEIFAKTLSREFRNQTQAYEGSVASSRRRRYVEYGSVFMNNQTIKNKKKRKTPEIQK